MWLRFALLLIVLLVAGCSAIAGSAPVATPTPVAYERVLPAGTIQVLDPPLTVGALEGDEQIGPHEMVMGITLGGEARAYPIGLMRRYGIANDLLGGQSIAVTFCNACNTGLAFSREVDDRVLTFEVSGLLFNNALVMTDRETGSNWSQIQLQALEGELAGQRLELLASNQMTWQEWVKAEPATTLVIDPRAPQRADSTTFIPPSLPSGEELIEESLHGYVAGIATAESATAYALDAVAREGLIQSAPDVAPPVLLVTLGEPGAVALWERVVDGQTLTFRLDDEQLIDQETESVWDPETGQAIRGSLSGKQLAPADGWITDWRGWLDLYPDATLVQ